MPTRPNISPQDIPDGRRLLQESEYVPDKGTEESLDKDIWMWAPAWELMNLGPWDKSGWLGANKEKVFCVPLDWKRKSISQK